MTTNNTDLSRQKDKTFILKFTAPLADIQKSRQSILKQIQKDFKQDGFRPGKVPLNIIEESISQERLIEDVASDVLSHIYSQKIDEHKLKPIIPPKIKFVTPPTNFDQDWQVELTSCELPEIGLDPKYLDQIKSQNSQKFDPKIDPKAAQDQKINKIFEIIVNNSQVELPPILLESEIQHRLATLVDQTNQAGITIEQYFKSKNTSLDKYQQAMSAQITQDWKINLGISQIATDHKIEVSPDEVKNLIQKNPKATNNNLLYFLLLQQKVLDYLQSI